MRARHIIEEIAGWLLVAIWSGFVIALGFFAVGVLSGVLR
jgi:hypothetical protein